jgi:hypothetical protein
MGFILLPKGNIERCVHHGQVTIEIHRVFIIIVDMYGYPHRWIVNSLNNNGIFRLSMVSGLRSVLLGMKARLNLRCAWVSDVLHLTPVVPHIVSTNHNARFPWKIG